MSRVRGVIALAALAGLGVLGVQELSGPGSKAPTATAPTAASAVHGASHTGVGSVAYAIAPGSGYGAGSVTPDPSLTKAEQTAAEASAAKEAGVALARPGVSGVTLSNFGEVCKGDRCTVYFDSSARSPSLTLSASFRDQLELAGGSWQVLDQAGS